MEKTSVFTIVLSITFLMLLTASLGEANPDRVGTLHITDEILRSKAAFGVVEEEIARGLNLGTLTEQDYRKLRGPVLLEIQTAIHSQLREQFGKIVHTIDFGDSSDSGSPSQSPSITAGDKPPTLHETASEIIQNFIAQKHISVIIISDAPLGIGEISAVRGLGGEVRSTYDIINGACVAIPVKSLSALIRRPFVTEVWPNSKANLEWSRLQQIGADRVHNPRPTGLGVTGDGVVVAVVDDGIDSSHPEFVNRIVDARGILGGLRDTGDLETYNDDHGTHVAGIIGAADDGNGITGVAPDVKLLDAKHNTPWMRVDDLFGPYTLDYGDVIDATGWAAQIISVDIPPALRALFLFPLNIALANLDFIPANQKADVINMSLGFDPWDYGLDGEDPLSKLIDQVVSNGTVVVKSAGNEAKRRASGSFTLSPNASPIAWHDFEFDVSVKKFKVTLIWDNEANDLDLAILNANGEICASRNHSGILWWNNAWKDKPKYGGRFYEQVECDVPDPSAHYIVQVEGHKGQGEQDYELWLEGTERVGGAPRRAVTFLEADRDSEYTVSVPGYSKKAITVGNVDYSNTWIPSSSQGPSNTGLIKPEVVAPGSEICSTVLSGNYDHKGGTSMAAPHVAGVAALILDAVGKNSNGKWNFSPDEVKSAIVRGAESGIGGISNTPDNAYGAGLVKADNIIFGGTVPSHGKLRFKITPRLLGSWFDGYFLNAENGYPNANPVSLTAAISWENGSHDLDLLLSHANGNPAGVASQTGSDYEKINGLFTPVPGSIYYLDVINRSKAPVTFTGASTHPIKSLIASDESNYIHIEALDVSCDGVVNVVDLLAVAEMLNKTGVYVQDVDGDGDVDLDDMEFIAVELKDAPGAPTAPNFSGVTLETVQQWLSGAKRMGHTDPNFLRGLAILEQLLARVIPPETALLPNYPNPFNPETWIPYQLSESTDVTVSIYAVDGKLVRTLALGHQAAGIYQSKSRAAYWDGRNAFGEPVASGLYFYTFTAGDFTATRKMLIRK